MAYSVEGGGCRLGLQGGGCGHGLEGQLCSVNPLT